MPKRMIGLFFGETQIGRILDMRQGLPPLPRLDIEASVSATSGNCLDISPDNSYAVAGRQSGSDNMSIYSDPANMAGRTNPAASFAGSVYCCAAGNAFYAFGGGSPFLYVFNKAGALQTVSTTGLGNIWALDFSPDGTKLAVVHGTTPFVRIYNTSDWSFVNGGTAANSSTYAARFSHDSSKLVIFSAASPFIAVYDAATGVRGYTNTNSAFSASSSLGGSARAVRYPDGKTLIYSLSSSPFLAKFDVTTNTPTAFTAPAPVIGTGGALWIDPDPEEDAVYLNHSIGSTNPARTLSKFRVSTGVMYADQPAQLYRSILYGSNSLNTAAAMLMTTPYRIRGTVRDVSNNPVARVVRAYKRSTGEMMAQTTSNASTGDYTLKLYDAGPYDVQFLTAEGELLNDLFFAKAEPEPVTG